MDFFNRRGTQRKNGAENRKERMAKMKNDETQITSAALCGFYLRGSPRLNLPPQGFFNRRGTQRKEGAENRKERMDKMMKSSLKTPPRPSAVYLCGSPRLNLPPQGFFNRRGTQRKEDADLPVGRQGTAKKEWLKMKNDETNITSAALCV